MKSVIFSILAMFTVVLWAPSVAQSAEVVPTELQQPGTQPEEVGALESPDKCDNCHGNSSKGVELSHEWGGSMMAHASRDPLFWATMAVSEQTFDGSGDLSGGGRGFALGRDDQATQVV